MIGKKVVARSASRSKSNKEQQEEHPASQSSVVVKDAKPKESEKKMSEVKSIIEYDTDLNEAEAPGPLPKGDYTGEIRGAEQKTSGKGNEYINVTFFIDADQYPADYTEGNPDGTILSFGRLSPENTARARWSMKKFVEGIGGTMGKTLDLNSWLGLRAKVTVVNEDYEGVLQAKISKVSEA
jgi:hypothetical protein